MDDIKIIFRNFIKQLKLAWNLLWDEEVPFRLKLIPLGIMLYVISPIDLLPDWIPIIGWIEDLLLAVMATYVFIRSAPPERVAFHLYGYLSKNLPKGQVLCSTCRYNNPAACGNPERPNVILCQDYTRKNDSEPKTDKSDKK